MAQQLVPGLDLFMTPQQGSTLVNSRRDQDFHDIKISNKLRSPRNQDFLETWFPRNQSTGTQQGVSHPKHNINCSISCKIQTSKTVPLFYLCLEVTDWDSPHFQGLIPNFWLVAALWHKLSLWESCKCPYVRCCIQIFLKQKWSLENPQLQYLNPIP